MGDQDRSTTDSQSACGDWVPPPELQMHWQTSPPAPEQQDKLTMLAAVIANEVIPRLLLANRPELAVAPPASDQMSAKLAERVGEFSELVVNHDATQSTAYFEALHKQGASIESLFQHLLAPTARRLGVLWDEDINDFFDVTRGIGNLQEIVRTFSSEFHSEISQPLSSNRALLMPLPGNQHTFGISLLREHFLREGWRVWCGPCESMTDISQLVKSQWFEMVGLSAVVIKHPEVLASDIRKIRHASLNKDIQIFVGGHAFNSQPELVAAVGADATATDGRQAVCKVLKSIVSGSRAT